MRLVCVGQFSGLFAVLFVAVVNYNLCNGNHFYFGGGGSTARWMAVAVDLFP